MLSTRGLLPFEPLVVPAVTTGHPEKRVVTATKYLEGWSNVSPYVSSFTYKKFQHHFLENITSKDPLRLVLLRLSQTKANQAVQHYVL